MIVDYFETSLYVDVYELRQEIYKYMYRFLLSNKVNTETAEYRSQRFQLYTYLNKTNTLTCNLTIENFLTLTNLLNKSSSEYAKLKGISERMGSILEKLHNNKSKRICLISYKLPVHARYHASSVYATEYYNVSLNNPRLFHRNCIRQRQQVENSLVELPCKLAYEARYEYVLANRSDNYSQKKTLEYVCLLADETTN